MKPFKSHTGVAAPLLIQDMNTDVIIPTARAVHASRKQMAEYAFEALRYTKDGTENPSFTLNQPRYRTASILISGDNFGCGSSREMAVWALEEMGLRCIIAPSFGDIFASNCIKNGLLPLRIPEDEITTLAHQVEAAEEPQLTIDLEACTITGPHMQVRRFNIDQASRQILLHGLDDISQTLQYEGDIRTFIERDSIERPWIHAGGAYRA